eukprot:COSAG01_NODE_20407_length_955_cov_1.239486_1_plen_98_part_00
MKSPALPVKKASFSQYPRGYQRSPDASGEEDVGLRKPSTSACIEKGGVGCTMGYTVVTVVHGCEYRYTEWCDFNTEGYALRVDWGRNVGTELYNHRC